MASMDNEVEFQSRLRDIYGDDVQALKDDSSVFVRLERLLIGFQYIEADLRQFLSDESFNLIRDAALREAELMASDLTLRDKSLKTFFSTHDDASDFDNYVAMDRLYRIPHTNAVFRRDSLLLSLDDSQRAIFLERLAFYKGVGMSLLGIVLDQKSVLELLHDFPSQRARQFIETRNQFGSLPAGYYVFESNVEVNTSNIGTMTNSFKRVPL